MPIWKGKEPPWDKNIDMDVHTPIDKKKFMEILDAVPICTVDVMFLNNSKTKTLLFKRVNDPLHGVFFAVGGRLLKNERIKDAAVRQVLRETGLSIFKDDLFFGGVQDEMHHNSVFKGISYHAVNIYYGYILDESIQMKLDNQHTECKWIDVAEETLHPFIKSRLKDLLLTI